MVARPPIPPALASCLQLVLLHVGDGSKASWLPRHLTPRYLENTYVGKAADLHVRPSSGVPHTVSCLLGGR
jgi:hypothetical protein